MPKFTSAERILVKSIVASLSIKRIPEDQIINEIYNQTNKTLTKSGLFYVKEAIKKESYHWYKTMRENQYEYIHEFRERINEILDLQKRHYAIADSPTVPIPIKQKSSILFPSIDWTWNKSSHLEQYLIFFSLIDSLECKAPTPPLYPGINLLIIEQ
jgi:hypothetical protein